MYRNHHLHRKKVNYSSIYKAKIFRLNNCKYKQIIYFRIMFALNIIFSNDSVYIFKGIKLKHVCVFAAPLHV